MALTSTTTFDVLGNTSTITFFNPSQIDQITYSNGTVIFEINSGFTLSKSDYLLYFQYLNAFNNQLFINKLPAISTFINTAWPLCVFDISFTNIGINKISYTQSSLGAQVVQINYLPSLAQAGFVTRSAPVTITLQEFFQAISMLTQYTTQVALN